MPLISLSQAFKSVIEVIVAIGGPNESGGISNSVMSVAPFSAGASFVVQAGQLAVAEVTKLTSMGLVQYCAQLGNGGGCAAIVEAAVQIGSGAIMPVSLVPVVAGVGAKAAQVVEAEAAGAVRAVQGANNSVVPSTLVTANTAGSNAVGRLTYDVVSESWTSPGGLIFGQGSAQGNRVLHVLEHTVPNPSKPVHSVFNVDRTQITGLIDDAWAARVGSGTLQANGNCMRK